jgi:hypothetical protein
MRQKRGRRKKTKKSRRREGEEKKRRSREREQTKRSAEKKSGRGDVMAGIWQANHRQPDCQSLHAGEYLGM